MVRQTLRPATALHGAGDSVRIEIEERTFLRGDPHRERQKRIEFTARLGEHRAEFRSVDIGGTRTDASDPHFEASWGGTRGRAIRESGRLTSMGPQTLMSSGVDGVRADLVEFSIGSSSRRCLRVLDLERGDEPQEFGQPIIDLENGRTLAYWQYRPETWDADSETWLAAHREESLTIDGVRYQRRNCTGRDEIALTDHALRGR